MRTATLQLYRPHEKQLEFHQSPHRFRVVSFGRQAGKSTMANNELIRRAWENPRTRYWFLSPIFSQAKDQYRKLLSLIPPQVIKRHSDSELSVELINESIIEYKSGEVLDRLRGATLHGAVIDEVRDQHKDLWPMVIRPMLTTTQGWAAFVSTPNGFDQFYDLFERSSTEKEWYSLHSPSTCNPVFTKKEFELLRSEMSEDEFAQEILAEFRELGVGKAYRTHGTWNQNEQNPLAIPGQKWSPYLPIVVGLDFNVGLMCWELGQYANHTAWFGDEIALKNTHTEECALILASKVKDHRPGVVLIGDASGKARKTSAAGQTDYTILERVLKNANIPFRNLTPEDNPNVKDRVNAVNAMLKSASGEIKLTYSPTHCKRLKLDLEKVKWKEGADGAVFDKSDPELTHASDAAGYPIVYYSDLLKKEVGGLKVIPR